MRLAQLSKMPRMEGTAGPNGRIGFAYPHSPLCVANLAGGPETHLEISSLMMRFESGEHWLRQSCWTVACLPLLQSYQVINRSRVLWKVTPRAKRPVSIHLKSSGCGSFLSVLSSLQCHKSVASSCHSRGERCPHVV